MPAVGQTLFRFQIFRSFDLVSAKSIELYQSVSRWVYILRKMLELTRDIGTTPVQHRECNLPPENGHQSFCALLYATFALSNVLD